MHEHEVEVEVAGERLVGVVDGVEEQHLHGKLLFREHAVLRGEQC